MTLFDWCLINGSLAIGYIMMALLMASFSEHFFGFDEEPEWYKFVGGSLTLAAICLGTSVPFLFALAVVLS